MKKIQRCLCLLLVLCMLLSVLPVTAMAAETGAEPSEQAATVLYQENFDTALPTGLDASSWERVELKGGGYALRGTKDGGGLLAALPMTSDLPTEYTIVADVALVKGLNGSGYSGRDVPADGWDAFLPFPAGSWRKSKFTAFAVAGQEQRGRSACET